ncbi:MAG: DNA primase [Candidatus Moraniibacteriota bacterium]
MSNNVEEIKARLNIVDVVGEYVRLTKGGVNWKGLCPFHHEKSPSFMVNEEKQIFYCFGCNKGGDVFSFVQEIESMDFREVLKLLAEKAGVQLEQYQGAPQEKDHKKRVLEALELATKFFETQLWKGMGKDKVLGYLNGRGIGDDSIRNFRVGYAPAGWDNILKFLLSRGFSLEEISKTGLLVEKSSESIQNTKYKIQDTQKYYDRFRDRIMFPIQDAMGVVIGYSARVAPGQDESQAKYINTPETLVYHKSKALYGLFHAKQAIKQKNYSLLVEGQMDVIACHQAGLNNTVAVSGTALTSEHVTILKRYSDNVAMLFDMDSAGKQAAQKSADLCFQQDVKVKMVTLADGKDAAEVAAKNPQLLLSAVANSVEAVQSFFAAALKQFDQKTAEGKRSIANSVLSHVANMTNQIEKIHWIKKMAHQLDVEEKVINDVLRSLTPSSFVSASQVKEVGKEEAAFRGRVEIVRDLLAGLIMADETVWQETVQREQEKTWVKQDELWRLLFETGAQVGFSYEALLETVQDEKLKKHLADLYFTAKYRFAEDGVTQYDSEQLRELVAEHIAQYQKELHKNELHDIMKEIKSAEERSDKEALKKLMSQFSKLSQETK